MKAKRKFLALLLTTALITGLLPPGAARATEEDPDIDGTIVTETGETAEVKTMGIKMMEAIPEGEETETAETQAVSEENETEAAGEGRIDLPVYAAASSGTCGDGLTWSISNNTLTITGTGDMYDYVYATYAPWYENQSNIRSIEFSSSMTHIGSNAFCDCDNLRSIVIPNSVESIGSAAFSDCDSLRSISIAGSVTSIGSDAFMNCKALVNLTLENGIKELGSYAFYGCTGLQALSLPNSVTDIGDSAFSECTALTSAPLPNGLTTLGKYAFSSTGLTSVTVPGSVASVGDYAFYACTALTDVILEEGVRNIWDYAFNQCTSLKSITIPASMEDIGFYAFSGCGSLSDVYYGGTGSEWKALTNGLTGDTPLTNANIHCNDEPSPVITYSVTFNTQGGNSISPQTVTSGSTVTRPSDPTRSGYTFDGWYTDTAYTSAYNFSTPVTGDLTLYAKWVEVSSYPSGTCGSDLKWELKNSILTISGTGAMDDYTYSSSTQETSAPWDAYWNDVTSVVLQSGVTTIGSYAFFSFGNATSITLPEGLTSIGTWALGHTTSLSSISFPSTLQTINPYAFFHSGLTSVTIPKSMAYYGNGMFTGCLNLQSIRVASGNTILKAVDGILFTSDGKTLVQYPAGKSGTSYTVPDGVTNIWYDAFRCAKLQSITIPLDVTSVGRYAFFDCDNLTDVYYGGTESDWDAVTIDDYNTPLTGATIHYAEDVDISGSCGTSLTWKLKDGTLTISGTGSMANYTSASSAPWYSYRSQITSLVVESGVTTIGNYACGGSYSGSYSALSRVTLPAGLVEIGRWAFAYVKNLTSISLPASLSTIGSYAFYQSGLTSIAIPKDLTALGNGAFAHSESLQSISVVSGNTMFQAVGGVLFSYDGKTLKQYPGGKSDTSYTVPEGVTGIGVEAFAGAKLQSITIPLDVTSVGQYAFEDCDSLTDVYYGGTESEWEQVSIGSSNDSLTNATIHYQDGSATSGKCGSNLTWTLEDGVLTISGTGDMYTYSDSSPVPWADYLDDITAIHIDSSVTSIGGNAFAHCNKLISVTLPSSVTSIGTLAFWNCDGLTSITIPSSVTQIDMGAFGACHALTQIYVASDSSTFCASNGILFNKDNTELVVYPAGKSATSYTVPSNVQTIGSYAFAGCNALNSITFPSSVQSMGSYAFCHCPALTSLSLPDGMTAISDNLFWNCGKLASVTIPASVTNIAWGAFDECVALTDVYYGGTESDWDAVTIGDYNTPLTSATVHYADPEVVKVVGLTVNKASTTIKVGGTEQLVATISPSNASDKSVRWISTDTSIATVNSSGVVTAKQEGKCTVLVTSVDGGFAATCTVTVQPDVTLTAISLSNAPTSATVGTSLDLSALVVTAIYSNETTQVVQDYSVSGYDQTQAGVQTIVISYQGCTASFTVTVREKSLTLVGVVLAAAPIKRDYVVGETDLDLDGMKLLAVFDDGTSQVVESSDYTSSGFTTTATGKKTITITYKGFSATFDIQVNAPVVEGIVETPKLSIRSFIGGKTVSLTTATDGANIYYTVDGSTPTTASKRYTESFSLEEDTTIKAIAVKSGMTDSKLFSAKITVSTVSAPVSSHTSGQELPLGTIVTLRSETSGSMIYYTTDGSTPTTSSIRYKDAIHITRDLASEQYGTQVIIQAFAVKDGYKNSEVITFTYEIPSAVSETTTASVGSSESKAGDKVTIPIYFFLDEEKIQMTSYSFTLTYNEETFVHDSVSSDTCKNLSFSREVGSVTISYSGEAVASGEMCSVTFEVLASATDGKYPFSISQIEADGTGAERFDFNVQNGSVTLKGSHNSLIEAKAEFVTADGKTIDSVDDINNTDKEIQANVQIENAEEFQTSEEGAGIQSITVILAVYERNGRMISFQSMEIMKEEMANVFTHTLDIPSDASVGSIKMMIVDGMRELGPLVPSFLLL